MVVINSYNEFAEETAVEPADTSIVGSGRQRPATEPSPSPSPDDHWNITKSNIAKYKAAP